MSRQSLMAELHCKFTPVYMDMNGRVYLGREIEKILQIEIPNTSIIDIQPTNLCKTQTSGFVYARPPFGCNNVNSSADTTETTTPTSDTREKGLRWAQTTVNAQSSFRSAIYNFIETSPSLRFLAKVTSQAFLLPFNAGVEYMRGYNAGTAIKAHVSAATVSGIASAITSYAISNSPRLAFATSWSIKGRNPVVMLIAWGVAYAVYPRVKDTILDGAPPRDTGAPYRDDFIWHRDSSGRDWWEQEYGR